MNEHLSEKCTEVNVKYYEEVHKRALVIWNKYSRLRSVGESVYLENFINSRDVPVPRLTIMDHKKKKANGGYPSRLLIPATNFTQGVAKLAFNVAKNVFDHNDVPTKKYIINRAQTLKRDVERIDRNATIKKNKDLFTFLDIENMYPSITFWQIKKAVRHYSETHVKDEGDLAAIEIWPEACCWRGQGAAKPLLGHANTIHYVCSHASAARHAAKTNNRQKPPEQAAAHFGTFRGGDTKSAISATRLGIFA